MFSVNFVNIPDAGTRNFGTYRDAAEFVERCGFHAVITSGGCVIAKNGPMGGPAVLQDRAECKNCQTAE